MCGGGWGKYGLQLRNEHVSVIHGLLTLPPTCYLQNQVNYCQVALLSNKDNKDNFLAAKFHSELTPLPCYDQRIQVTAISSVFAVSLQIVVFSSFAR